MSSDYLQRLITLDELARELGVHRRTIQRWHRYRKGPPRIKVGRQIYYREETVREWLVENESSETH